MWIKTTMRYHLTPSERPWLKKSTNNKCLRGWECKSVQPLWKTASSFLKRLKIELPYDSAILVLGIDPKRKVIQKDTCTPEFIAAVYTIGRIWKQPRLALGSRSTMLVGITQSFEVLSRKKGRGWVNSLSAWTGTSMFCLWKSMFLVLRHLDPDLDLDHWLPWLFGLGLNYTTCLPGS